MLATIWSILFWAVGLLVALLVLLVVALFCLAIVKDWRTLRQLKSNNPENREQAAKRVRDNWRLTRWRDFDWRSRAQNEKLLINALSSTNTKSRIKAVISLGDIASAESVPILILLLDSNDDAVAFIAGEAISAIRERLEIKGGFSWGVCPRCESSDTKEGNYTGWVCQTCNLHYSPKGSRNPLAFGLSGGFHGGPWDRSELVKLLEGVNDLAANDLLKGAKGELSRTFSADAKRILAKRQQILKNLGAGDR